MKSKGDIANRILILAKCIKRCFKREDTYYEDAEVFYYITWMNLRIWTNLKSTMTSISNLLRRKVCEEEFWKVDGAFLDELGTIITDMNYKKAIANAKEMLKKNGITLIGAFC